MADTAGFFNDYLPNRLASKPETVEAVNAVFVFEIDGAGTWTVDLTKPGGEVREGGAEGADCVVSAAKEDWEKFLDNPGLAMQLFMMGKIRASNLGMATKLQQILG